MTVSSLLPPLYITFLYFLLVLYFMGAFALGSLGAFLTLPVLHYTGYGLLPPKRAPAGTGGDVFSAVLMHHIVGGLLAALALIGTLWTSKLIPELVEYRFARLSPWLEALPKLALATGLVLLGWTGYLVYAREAFSEQEGEGQRTALVTSVLAAVAFGVSFLSVAVVTTATRAI